MIWIGIGPAWSPEKPLAPTHPMFCFLLSPFFLDGKLACPHFIAFAAADAILQKSNRVARRVLRPLGYKMLEVQGLNPVSVSPAAARAALEAELTAEQQAAVDAEAERLFEQVSLGFRFETLEWVWGLDGHLGYCTPLRGGEESSRTLLWELRQHKGCLMREAGRETGG
jgi:hypothetical protein